MTGADHSGFQRLALRLAAAIALGAAGLISGCAASSSFMGLDLFAPNLPVDLRELARRAQSGDKQAQLELGIAFEEGRGVAQDWKRARALYRRAAKDEPGQIWVYVPSPGGGAPARVLSVSSGVRSIGLIEARKRLNLINEAQ